MAMGRDETVKAVAATSAKSTEANEHTNNGTEGAIQGAVSTSISRRGSGLQEDGQNKVIRGAGEAHLSRCQHRDSRH